MPKSTREATTPNAILPRLPERLSAQLFAGATTRHLNAGETLFSAGDSGDGCYRLERGLLKVIISSPRGEERILAFIGPGAIAGGTRTGARSGRRVQRLPHDQETRP